MGVSRGTIQDILKEINTYKYNFSKLCNNEILFIDSISMDATHYGFTFTEKQLSWLKSIYDKLKHS